MTTFKETEIPIYVAFQFLRNVVDRESHERVSKARCTREEIMNTELTVTSIYFNGTIMKPSCPYSTLTKFGKSPYQKQSSSGQLP